MSVFKVGKATVTRIEETYLPVYPATDIFPELDAARLAEHAYENEQAYASLVLVFDRACSS